MKNHTSLVVGETPRAAILALAGLFLLAAAPVFGQTASDDKKDDTVKLEKFTVTGSYIPAAADEANALPVQILTVKQIEQTGVTSTLLDVLRKAVPQIVGGLNIGVENGNIAGGATNGGAQIALRNTATLVLIDGQRAAFSPVSGTGGFQFVDLNNIPVSAVERVEVLTDGASAIYGSDAVSGVINIILKKNFQGAEIGASYGFSKPSLSGIYRSESAHFILGASTGKTNITVSGEWGKTDPLYMRDFSYTAPAFGTVSFAGIVNTAGGQFYQLAPSLNQAPDVTPTTLANLATAGYYKAIDSNAVGLIFDLAHVPTFANSLDKQLALFAFDHTISDTMSVKGSVSYAGTVSQYQINPQPIVLRINVANDPTTQNLPGIPITDVRAQVRNRFVDAGARIYNNDTTSIRGTVELDGKIGSDWNWAFASVYNTSKQTALGIGQILNSALLAGIRGGNINLTAIHQDPVKLAAANIFGNSIADFSSTLISYDARVNGRVFDLPGGSMFMAAGVGYRKEALSGSADKNSLFNPVTGASAWNNGVSINPFAAQRIVKSEFLEVKVPITGPKQNIAGLHDVSIDAAIRHEIYSDTTDPTVPKVSLRWLPFNDEFAVRSTYSKSFSAPTLYSLFGPTSSGATASFIGLQSYNTAGQPIATPFPALQGGQQSGANPNLKPSNSKNYTVGFVYSPKTLKGFSIAVDYYNIKETDLVGSLATSSTMVQDVERYGPASKFSQYVHLNDFGQLGGVQVTTPGQLHGNPANVYVDQFAANVSSQNQDGVDITLKYSFKTQYGAFDVQSTWVNIQSFQVEASSGQGFTEFSDTNGSGTLPKYREYTTVSWENGAYSAALSNTFIRSVQSSGGGPRVPSYTSFDLQGSIEVGKLVPQLRGLRMTVGANNLFNKYPPVDAYSFSSPPSDTGIYGSVGRFVYGNFSYKF